MDYLTWEIEYKGGVLQLVNNNIRNHKKVEEKTELYLNAKITAEAYGYEERDKKKDKWNKKKSFYCRIYSPNSGDMLNLGECNDGSKFTAINQAINQAKEFVNTCNMFKN